MRSTIEKLCFLGLPVLLLVILYQRECTSRKLAESTFYKDSFVEMKVVLRLENMPLHYKGEVTSVACRSSQTRTLPAWKSDFVEAGWRVVPQPMLNPGGPGLTKPIGAWAAAAKNAFLVTDKMTVMIPRHTDLWVTWDGCGAFARWDIQADFPHAFLVKTNPELQACQAMHAEQKARGSSLAGDCAGARWSRGLEFSKLMAKRDGAATFQVRSSAFQNDQAYTISTTDFGKHWRTLEADVALETPPH